MKRLPLLVDRFLAQRRDDMIPYRSKRFSEAMQAHVLDSARFVLDRSATDYFADMVREIPEAIAYGQEFAIAPHTKMWIEIPHYDSFWERCVNRKPSFECDETVAYFINGPRAYVFCGMREKQQSYMMPIEYHLNQPLTLEQEFKLVEELGTSRLNIDGLYWGASFAPIGTLVDDETAVPAWSRALRERHSFEIMTLPGARETRRAAFHRMYKTSAGDLRNIIGLLLFLNRTRKVTYQEEIAPARGFIRAKPALFTRHSVIRISLNPLPMLRKMYESERSSGLHKRNHAVRGHFCHDLVARLHCHDAEANSYHHNWRELEPFDPRYRPGTAPTGLAFTWRCLNCGGWKWWRNECRRGDIRLGIVQQEYEVTA